MTAETPSGEPGRDTDQEDLASMSALSPLSDAAVVSFAPEEPTDGRGVADWKTRYADRAARRKISYEAVYVLVMMLACATVMICLALQFPRSELGLSQDRWNSLSPFAFAVAGGAAGGSLFAAKWLYHSVARGFWNSDRWLWRVFTPYMAAGAALTVIALSAGRVVPIFGAELVRTNSGALGVSLLVGYFAERTFSRLERLAEQHLGAATRYHPAKRPTGDGSDGNER